MPELAKHPRYKVGDLLQLRSRGPRWVGTVTEARGSYSPTGHVLYHVRVPMDPEPLFLLVREEETADPLVLARLAEDFYRLMDSPKARERLRERCRAYFHEREANPDRPPPMDLLGVNKSAQLTLAEKYALLAALHAAVRADQEFDPAPKPDGLSWQEFADRDPKSYQDAIRWAALVDRVKEWLGPKNASEIQSWLEDVQADLQDLQHCSLGKNQEGRST